MAMEDASRCRVSRRDAPATVYRSRMRTIVENREAAQSTHAPRGARALRWHRWSRSSNGTSMRQLLLTALLIWCGACRAPSPPSYLFLWAGDAEEKASDFLAVIDASPTSARYGAIVASVP